MVEYTIEKHGYSIRMMSISCMRCPILESLQEAASTRGEVSHLTVNCKRMSSMGSVVGAAGIVFKDKNNGKLKHGYVPDIPDQNAPEGCEIAND